SHYHISHNVTIRQAPLGDIPLASLHFDHFFSRHQDAPEMCLQASPLDSFLQRARHALFHARIGVHHVPALAGGTVCARCRRGLRRRRAGGFGVFDRTGRIHHFHPSTQSYSSFSTPLSTRSEERRVGKK